MSEKNGLPKIFDSNVPLIDYPESPITEAIERKINLSLPVIEKLNDQNLSDTERLTILKQATDSAFQSFIYLHGDPFGEAITEDDAQIEQSGKVLLSSGLIPFPL